MNSTMHHNSTIITVTFRIIQMQKRKKYFEALAQELCLFQN